MPSELDLFSKLFGDFSAKDHVHDWDSDSVTWVKDGILLSKWLREDNLDAIKDFEVRDDDVWLVTYPKSGTIWMQAIMSLVAVKRNEEQVKTTYMHAKYTILRKGYGSTLFLVICGSWFQHNLFWWKRRHLPNVFFLKYEDMKIDPKGAIIQVAGFMGYELSDDAINTIVEKSSFKCMKSSEKVGLPKEKNEMFDTKYYKGQSSFIRKIREPIFGRDGGGGL
ncbi:amine sulfotransferase-like [Antedon mediterranea]|uniref:amine sulfotransferase-like n=1 Tax=Antedon mediterranea TaxID=105859 RepID=UPI003AF7F045